MFADSRRHKKSLTIRVYLRPLLFKTFPKSTLLKAESKLLLTTELGPYIRHTLYCIQIDPENPTCGEPVEPRSSASATI